MVVTITPFDMTKYLFGSFLVMMGLQLEAQDKQAQYQDPQNMPVKPTNTDCQELPDSFVDLSEALISMENTRFHYDQKIKTTRRRGLMQARYVSCDFKTGYLIIQYDGQNQVYPNVDIQLWEDFQQTADIDGFYFKNIKDLPSVVNK